MGKRKAEQVELVAVDDEVRPAAYDPTLWYAAGLCFYCHEPLAARNHGSEVRHAESRTPYSYCVAAILARHPRLRT